MDNVNISALANADLLAKTKEVAADERGRLSDLVELLAEIDDRKLYRDYLGYNSIFSYCVCVLRYSESAAYRRIRAARALRIFPPISVLLRAGSLNLETIALLHPHLTDPDAAALIQKASGMRVWEVERLLAHRQPPAPERDVLRFMGPSLPTKVSAEDASPLLSPPPIPAGATNAAPPVAPETQRSLRVAFTADEAFLRLLQRARVVMRHKYPDGRLHGILRDALNALLDKKDRDRGRARRA